MLKKRASKTTKISYKIILCLVFAINCFGQNSFLHPTCDTYIHSFQTQHKWDNKLIKRLKKHLSEKGYNIKPMPENKKIGLGNFHVKIKRTLFGKVYKQCLIEVEIKKSKTRFAMDQDKIFFKKESTRKFPRQTFDGQERCKMAINDLFFSIDICKKQE